MLPLAARWTRRHISADSSSATCCHCLLITQVLQSGRDENGLLFTCVRSCDCCLFLDDEVKSESVCLRHELHNL